MIITTTSLNGMVLMAVLMIIMMTDDDADDCLQVRTMLIIHHGIRFDDHWESDSLRLCTAASSAPSLLPASSSSPSPSLPSSSRPLRPRPPSSATKTSSQRPPRQPFVNFKLCGQEPTVAAQTDVQPLAGYF